MSSTYSNPVYPNYMADPFVLLHDGRYYAYGTALERDGKQFPVLTSDDLVNWTYYDMALISIEGADQFWAPEVAYDAGTFYLYYSARGVDGSDHQLRVATSSSPHGPFTDSRKLLVPDQPFTIDAHPFRAPDGTWYLYYARDFLEPDDRHHVGTGIVVDRMLDMTTLAGDPRLVVRPHSEWQVFQRERPMYGSVTDWYTVEGAAVLSHAGRYYCFYSGGRWENENYGIAYVVADHPLGPYTYLPHPTALVKTVPNEVIGPGHHSFTTAPNDAMVYVYHAWDANMTTRLMRVDRFRWIGDEPHFDTPTVTPQPGFDSEGNSAQRSR